MRRIFIDGGSNNGCSVKLFRKYYPKAEKYEIFCFEASPNFKEFYENLDVKFINKAVWIFDGTLNFYLGQKKHSMASSAFKEKSTGNLDKKNPIKVPCIDLSEWIKVNFHQEDEIILKLDVEGAEYKILRKMIDDKTIDYIKKLYIDWHYKKIGVSEREHMSLINLLKSKNLPAYNWSTESQTIGDVTRKKKL